MIVLIPTHGLCNRMRAIDSVLGLKKNFNNKVKIIWERNTGLNCDFETLFLPLDNIRSINMVSSYSRLCQLKKNAPFLGFIFKFLEKVYFLKILDQKKMEMLINEKFDFTELTQYRFAILRTNSRFFQSDSCYKDFILQSSIYNLLEKATQNFNSNTIGVHIRRTDNKIAIEYSPVELIVEKMMAEIENNQETNFFLATDSEKVKNEIINIFGNRILYYESSLTRSTRDGIMDATLELYALSRTKKILGSYWSSYSVTAAQIGKIDLQIIKV